MHPNEDYPLAHIPMIVGAGGQAAAAGQGEGGGTSGGFDPSSVPIQFLSPGHQASNYPISLWEGYPQSIEGLSRNRVDSGPGVAARVAGSAQGEYDEEVHLEPAEEIRRLESGLTGLSADVERANLREGKKELVDINTVIAVTLDEDINADNVKMDKGSAPLIALNAIKEDGKMKKTDFTRFFTIGEYEKHESEKFKEFHDFSPDIQKGKCLDAYNEDYHASGAPTEQKSLLMKISPNSQGFNELFFSLLGTYYQKPNNNVWDYYGDVERDVERVVERDVESDVGDVNEEYAEMKARLAQLQRELAGRADVVPDGGGGGGAAAGIGAFGAETAAEARRRRDKRLEGPRREAGQGGGSRSTKSFAEKAADQRAAYAEEYKRILSSGRVGDGRERDDGVSYWDSTRFSYPSSPNRSAGVMYEDDEGESVGISGFSAQLQGKFHIDILCDNFNKMGKAQRLELIRERLEIRQKYIERIILQNLREAGGRPRIINVKLTKNFFNPDSFDPFVPTHRFLENSLNESDSQRLNLHRNWKMGSIYVFDKNDSKEVYFNTAVKRASYTEPSASGGMRDWRYQQAAKARSRGSERASGAGSRGSSTKTVEGAAMGDIQQLLEIFNWMNWDDATEALIAAGGDLQSAVTSILQSQVNESSGAGASTGSYSIRRNFSGDSGFSPSRLNVTRGLSHYGHGPLEPEPE